MKVGRRKFDGREISYRQVQEKQTFHVNIFGKDPVQDEYEVWAEICTGESFGQKMKIYADDLLAGKLQRGNQFEIRVKKVLKHHLRIFRTIKKKSLKKNPA